MIRYGIVILLSVVISPVALRSEPLHPELETAIQRVHESGQSDRVLNILQAATLALDLDEIEEAGKLFDEALSGITAVYAGTEQAAAARSLWKEEGSKIFKGEPYERAMAFYYRALIDIFNSDLENARAGFKSALLQDAFAEEEQHKADFALMMFLEAWCSHLLGATALAEERFAEVVTFRPGFDIPAKDHNLLIVVETGKAPRKLQDGIGGNLLVYRQGKRIKEIGVRAKIGSESISLLPMESIYWQASTRGGRPIDSILEGQIRFKQNTQKTAQAVSGVVGEASTYAALYGESGGALAAVAAVAGIAALVSNQMTARADDRYWNNLPDMVHVYTMPLPEGVKEVQLEFLDVSGKVIEDLSQQQPIRLDKHGNGIVWARARRASDVDK